MFLKQEEAYKRSIKELQQDIKDLEFNWKLKYDNLDNEHKKFKKEAKEKEERLEE